MPYNTYFYGLDWPLLLVLLCAVIGFIAQGRVSSTYNKFSQLPALSGISAAQAAEKLLHEAGIRDVSIEYAKGVTLSDHYDPRNKVLRLSQGVYESSSIAALGVAAHEVGHAIQHAEGYGPLRVRNTILPVVNIASQASMPLFFVGLLLGFSQIAMIGVVLYAAAVLFQLITLPVEFNASSRALENLEIAGVLTRDETPYAKKVLSAAASTYVAAALVSIAQLLRLASIAGRRNR